MGKYAKKKKFPWLLIPIIFVVAAICVFGTVRMLYIFPHGEPLLRSTKTADLRHMDLSVEEYKDLCAELPDCHILWNIPIGDEVYDCSTREIRLNTVRTEDIPLFSYFDDLQRIDARNATCYDELAALQEALPDCHITWEVHLGSASFAPDTENLRLNGSGATAKELAQKLSLFSAVTQVELTDTVLAPEQMRQLSSQFPGVAFLWTVEVSGTQVLNTATELSFAGEKPDVDALVAAAEFLPEVTAIDLRGCGLTVQELLAVQEAFGASISSELSVYGVEFDTDTTHLYLNDIPMESVAQIEEILPLMPKLEWVEMCGCGISSEEMDALWKRHPNTRFVWEVKIGRATLRTDCTNFIGAKHGYLANASIADPYKDKYNRLFDEDCVEFKYCVDMVCLDLGHMGITDYSFLEFMPKLRYLILADTHGSDFSALSNLKELVFLELFLTDFHQPEVLTGLSKLEDLNIAYTSVDDPTALMEMTWLKRLWVSYSKMSFDEKVALEKALPDTHVDYTAAHSTANGWRTGYLYFEMRDYLGMYYLE